MKSANALLKRRFENPQNRSSGPGASEKLDRAQLIFQLKAPEALTERAPPADAGGGFRGHAPVFEKPASPAELFAKLARRRRRRGHRAGVLVSKNKIQFRGPAARFLDPATDVAAQPLWLRPPTVWCVPRSLLGFDRCITGPPLCGANLCELTTVSGRRDCPAKRDLSL